MAKKNKCKFCNKEFRKESTLVNHMCEKKHRWLQKDDKLNQMAFHAWIKFIEYNTKRKKKPTYEEFMNSKLFIGFIKYARHLRKLNAIDSNDYTDFLIKHGVKLQDWTKDFPYETYMRQTLAKETPERALERGLYLMEEWAISNNKEITDFFFDINTGQAVYWITTGKISPWLIFCASTSDKLFERFTPEQLQIVEEVIDSARWKLKIQKFDNEFRHISKVLKEVGV